MLKGHVFKKQIFTSEVFAFWIDTLLDHKCGIGDYGNKMNLTYSASNITVENGLVCIRGRFVEEDTSTTLSAGTDTAFCKLVIEIDLDKENTESELNQVSYKIVKGTTSYPALTQNDIVKNNSGKYQYELARFKTNINGITDFTDRRTYLDFNCIFTEMQSEYQEVLNELKEKLKNVEDGSAYILNQIEKQTITGSDSVAGVGSYSYEAVFKKLGKLVNVFIEVKSDMISTLGYIMNIPSFATPESNVDSVTKIASAILKDCEKTQRRRCCNYIY